MARRTRQIQLPNKTKTIDFIKSKINEWECAGLKVSLGTLENGIWQEYVSGDQVNHASKVFRVGTPSNAKYVSLKSLEDECEFCNEQLESRMQIIGVY